MKTDGKQVQGLVIISAKELTVVQIMGAIPNPSMLGEETGGKMGIPRMEMGPKNKPPKKDDD